MDNLRKDPCDKRVTSAPCVRPVIMANVRVAVRVRPLSEREVDTGSDNIISAHGNCLTITNVKVEGAGEYGDSSRDRVKRFTFDYCYDSSVDRSASADYASQELVYQDLGTEVLQAASDGYNACLFAYGQTGTGKTFTMMGYPGEIGLTPRICEGLFGYVNECPEESVTFRVQISYMEIYNERVRDLLKVSTHPERFTLKVREHPKEGPYVQDLSRHQVKDYHKIQTLLDRGNLNRTTAATHMHEHSSRSHAIVTLHFTQAKLENGLPSETVSKIHLVDLAGSERADPNYHANYKGRITEGASINKSLNTLANVIKALAEKSILAWSSETMGSSTSCSSGGETTVGSPQNSGGRKTPRTLYIPYRDSVLTWILKDSLGGNSKTLMIATVTPASKYYNETISTLRYAQRAKSIVNKPVVNEDANVSLIRQLREEIERLKQMLASATTSNSPIPSLNELLCYLPGMDKLLPYTADMEAEEGGAALAERDPGTILSEKLKENEAMANQLTQSWLDKWSETQSLMQESDLSIRGLGGRSTSYGVIIDSQLPHLIGMDDDILSTGVIIFHLKEGKTLIGREDARREQDIVLEGPGIQSEHCKLQNADGQVILYPRSGAQCTVNGVMVHKPTPLSQGDVVLLGKSNLYRFNNPAQAAELRRHRQLLRSATLQDRSEMLSSASSMASLSDLEVSRAPPLRMFNPKSDSAHFCLELEQTYGNEADRIEHARNQLDRLRAEVNEREEARQEEEERLWAEHEKHRQELEAEKIRLASLRDKLLTSEEQAQELLLQQQQNLDDQEALYIEELQKQLDRLTRNKGGDSSAYQQTTVHPESEGNTDIENGHDSSRSADVTTPSPAVAITGADGQEICQRKISVEGRIKGLAQNELLHNFTRQHAIDNLQRRVDEMEEEILQSRMEVETRCQQIQEKEEQYKDADASRLDRIREQKEKLEELQRQEEQLELYLEEKQDLMAVKQAFPKPLRGACSELTLTRHYSGDGGFRQGKQRAASETNLGERVDGADVMYGRSFSCDSQESLGNSSMLFQSFGSISGSDDFELSDMVDRFPDGGSDLSLSVGSEVGSEELLTNSSVNPGFSSASRQSGNQKDGAGHGRSRIRSGRGRSGILQSPVEGRSEMAEKKLTARAAEVTSRLYRTKGQPSESQRNFLRSKRNRNAAQISYPPLTRQSPSPQPSSKSRSPLPHSAGSKDVKQDSALSAESKDESKADLDKSRRTKLGLLTKSQEDSVDGNVKTPPVDKSRGRQNRPWKRERATANGDRLTRSLSNPKLSPTALNPKASPTSNDPRSSPALLNPRASTSLKKASSSSSYATKAADKSKLASGKPKPSPGSSSMKGRDVGKAIEKDMKRTTPPNTSSPSGEKSALKEPSSKFHSGCIKHSHRVKVPRRMSAGDVSPKTEDSAMSVPSKGLPFSSSDELRSSDCPSTDPRRHHLSGSDSLLLAGRPQPRYRPRSRLRQIPSASSLPSVPEAAAENEAELEPPSGVTDLNMADLVAAVPRRQKRGRRGLTEGEEERRHSEPVGEKWAEALAQYTVDIESGLGPEGLRNITPDSPASSHDWSGDIVTVPHGVGVPQVLLVETPSDCTDTTANLKNVESQPFTTETCSQDETEDVTPRPSDQQGSSTLTLDFASENVSMMDSSPMDTPRAGDKREHETSGEQRTSTEMLPKKKKKESNNTAENISIINQSTVPGSMSEMASLSAGNATLMSDHVEITDDSCGGLANITRKQSEGSFSVDSLDDVEEDPGDSNNVSVSVDVAQMDIEQIVTNFDRVDCRFSGGPTITDNQYKKCEHSETVQKSFILDSSQSNQMADSELRTATSDTGSEASDMKNVFSTPSSDSLRTQNASLNGGELGTVPVDVLTLLGKKGKEEEEESQVSDDALSSSRVKQQIQAWQEVLQQLSPRATGTAQGVSSATSNNTGSAATHNSSNTSKRGKRRQHTRVLKGSDSDHAEHFSDDSLASGTNSLPSSRPSSGSRRRRRPASKPSETAAKKRRGHSSEEYVTSENDSVYSDDSLTHSTERHEACTSQVSDIRQSSQQLTSNLQGCEEGIETESAQYNLVASMAEKEKIHVSDLVSFFEYQFNHPENEGKDGGESGEQRHGQSLSMASLCSEDGNSSASEGTQTVGGSVVMSKAPVSVMSAGDLNHVVSDGVLKALSSTDNIQEESNFHAQSHRSWKLSITPTDTWNCPETLQVNDTKVAEECPDRPPQRRKSKGDGLNSPEKRQRQDKLKDLHSKYGLNEELDCSSDDNKLEDQPTNPSGHDPHQHVDSFQMESSTHKTFHKSQTDIEGNVRFEVTINRDETNVLYNVEKTEYKTYTLRDREGNSPVESTAGTVPNVININMTNTITHQQDDCFETVTKERVIFQEDCEDGGVDDGVIITERTYAESRSLEFEQDRQGDRVNRESSAERHLTDEECHSRLKVSDPHSTSTVEPCSAQDPTQVASVVQHNKTQLHIGGLGSSASVELPSSVSISALKNSEQRKHTSSRDITDHENIGDLGQKVYQNRHEIRLTEQGSHVTSSSVDPYRQEALLPGKNHTSRQDVEVDTEVFEETVNEHYTLGDREREPGREVVSSPNDSFYSTVSSEERAPGHHSVNVSSTEIHLSQNGQIPAVSGDTSVEHHSAVLPEDMIQSRSDLVSTSLSHNDTASSVHSSQYLSPASSTDRLEGRLQLKSDSSQRTDDAFYSPDTTILSTGSSSGSSDYRTPQQSPRGHPGHGPATVSTAEQVQRFYTSVPSAEEASVNEQPRSRLLPVVNGGEGGRVVNGNNSHADRGGFSLLSAMAAAVGRQLVGNEEQMEAMREVLKQEVERKIARLQRRVRSLSDSAISSDFTETESTSVSPRSSRIPVMDGKAEGLSSDAPFYNGAFPQSPQELFLAWREEMDDPHVLQHMAGRSKEEFTENTLEDSGNIRDYQWKGNHTNQPEEGHSIINGTVKQGQTFSDEGQHKLSYTSGMSAKTRTVLPHQDVPVTNSSHPTEPFAQQNHTTSSSHEQVPNGSNLKAAKRSVSSAQKSHPEATLQFTKSYLAPLSVPIKTNDLFSLPGRFPERVVESLLSVKQAWRPTAYISHMLSSRRGKGFYGRRTKSLSDLTELAAAQNRSNLEENLLEEAKLIMQVSRVPSGLDLTTSTTRHGFENSDGGESTYDQNGVAVEWIDGHFHPTKYSSASFVPHRPRASSEGISHAWLVSAERGTLHGSSMDSSETDSSENYPKIHTQEQRMNLVPRSISEQAVRRVIAAGLSDFGYKQMQSSEVASPMESASTAPSHNGTPYDALSITSTISEFGSSTLPSLSGLSADISSQEERMEDFHHHQQSSETGNNSFSQSSETGSSSLLSSGELELAAINATAAVGKSHTDANPTSMSEVMTVTGAKVQTDTHRHRAARSSTKSNEMARNFGSSPRRWGPRQHRGRNRYQSPASRQDRNLSPGEFVLPEKTVQLFQQAGMGLPEQEALEDILQSETCEHLDSAGLSAAQQKMLQSKAMSISNLGHGRYTNEEDEEEITTWQLDRSASLACLEGIVLEEDTDEADSSADSICFVFMDQRSSEEAAKFRALGGSFTTSEGSERVIAYSQSTDNIPHEAHFQRLMPPFSEQSASMNNIYEAASTSVQRNIPFHRSRSASLLDVGTSAVEDDELDEHVFPPRVCADSEASLEGTFTAPMKDILSSFGTDTNTTSVHTDVTKMEGSSIRAALFRTAHSLERSEQYMFMASPEKFFSSRPVAYAESQPEQMFPEAESVRQAEYRQMEQVSPTVIEVETGQPYFRYRSPGTQPEHHESGSQTETKTEISPRRHRYSFSNDISFEDVQSDHISPMKRSQSTGSLETLNLSSLCAGENPDYRQQQGRLPLSPKSKQWVELSNMMLESTHILQNLRQTFSTQSRWSSDGSQGSLSSPRTNVLVSGEAPVSGAVHINQTGKHQPRLQTGTQPHSLNKEKVLPNGSSGRSMPAEPQSVVVKVNDTSTQTGSSLGDLLMINTQTHTEFMEISVSKQNVSASNVRTGMLTTGNSMDSNLVDSTCQTGDVAARTSASMLTKDVTYSSEEGQDLTENTYQTGIPRRNSALRMVRDSNSSTVNATNMTNTTCQTGENYRDDLMYREMRYNSSSLVHELRSADTVSQTDQTDTYRPVPKTVRENSSSTSDDRKLTNTTCQTSEADTDNLNKETRESSSSPMTDLESSDALCQTDDTKTSVAKPTRDGSSSTTEDQNLSDFTCQTDQVDMDDLVSRETRDSSSSPVDDLKPSDTTCQTDDIETRILKATRETSSSTMDDLKLTDTICQTEETDVDNFVVSLEMRDNSSSPVEDLQSVDTVCQTDNMESRVSKSTRDSSSSTTDDLSVTDTTCQTDEIDTEDLVSTATRESSSSPMQSLEVSDFTCQTSGTVAQGPVSRALRDSSCSPVDDLRSSDFTCQTDEIDGEKYVSRASKDNSSSTREGIGSREITCQTDDGITEATFVKLKRETGCDTDDLEPSDVLRQTDEMYMYMDTAAQIVASKDSSSVDRLSLADAGKEYVKIETNDGSSVNPRYVTNALRQVHVHRQEEYNQNNREMKNASSSTRKVYTSDSNSQTDQTPDRKVMRDAGNSADEPSTSHFFSQDEAADWGLTGANSSFERPFTSDIFSQTDKAADSKMMRDASSDAERSFTSGIMSQTVKAVRTMSVEKKMTRDAGSWIQGPHTSDTTSQTDQLHTPEESKTADQKPGTSRFLTDRLQMSQITSQTETFPEDMAVLKDTRNASSSMESLKTLEQTCQTELVGVTKTRDASSSAEADVCESSSQTDAVTPRSAANTPRNATTPRYEKKPSVRETKDIGVNIDVDTRDLTEGSCQTDQTLSQWSWLHERNSSLTKESETSPDKRSQTDEKEDLHIDRITITDTRSQFANVADAVCQTNRSYLSYVGSFEQETHKESQATLGSLTITHLSSSAETSTGMPVRSDKVRVDDSACQTAVIQTSETGTQNTVSESVPTQDTQSMIDMTSQTEAYQHNQSSDLMFRSDSSSSQLSENQVTGLIYTSANSSVDRYGMKTFTSETFYNSSESADSQDSEYAMLPTASPQHRQVCVSTQLSVDYHARCIAVNDSNTASFEDGNSPSSSSPNRGSLYESADTASSGEDGPSADQRIRVQLSTQQAENETSGLIVVSTSDREPDHQHEEDHINYIRTNPSAVAQCTTETLGTEGLKLVDQTWSSTHQLPSEQNVRQTRSGPNSQQLPCDQLSSVQENDEQKGVNIAQKVSLNEEKERSQGLSDTPYLQEDSHGEQDESIKTAVSGSVNAGSHRGHSVVAQWEASQPGASVDSFQQNDDSGYININTRNFENINKETSSQHDEKFDNSHTDVNQADVERQGLSDERRHLATGGYSSAEAVVSCSGVFTDSQQQSVAQASFNHSPAYSDEKGQTSTGFPPQERFLDEQDEQNRWKRKIPEGSPRLSEKKKTEFFESSVQSLAVSFTSEDKLTADGTTVVVGEESSNSENTDAGTIDAPVEKQVTEEELSSGLSHVPAPEISSEHRRFVSSSDSSSTVQSSVDQDHEQSHSLICPSSQIDSSSTQRSVSDNSTLYSVAYLSAAQNIVTGSDGLTQVSAQNYSQTVLDSCEENVSVSQRLDASVRLDQSPRLVLSGNQQIVPRESTNAVLGVSESTELYVSRSEESSEVFPATTQQGAAEDSSDVLHVSKKHSAEAHQAVDDPSLLLTESTEVSQQFPRLSETGESHSLKLSDQQRSDLTQRIKTDRHEPLNSSSTSQTISGADVPVNSPNNDTLLSGHISDSVSTEYGKAEHTQSVSSALRGPGVISACRPPHIPTSDSPYSESLVGSQQTVHDKFTISKTKQQEANLRSDARQQSVQQRSDQTKQRTTTDLFSEDSNSDSEEEEPGGELSFKRDEKMEQSPDTIRTGNVMTVETGPIIIVRPTSPYDTHPDQASRVEPHLSGDEIAADRSRGRKPRRGHRGHGGELSYYRRDTVEGASRAQLSVPSKSANRLQGPSLSADNMLPDESQQTSSVAESDVNGLSVDHSGIHNLRLGPDSRVSETERTQETGRPQARSSHRRDLDELPPSHPDRIMNEIEKLREEHNRMMLLLERSRHDPSSPMVNRLHRARSASPCMTHAGYWSSNSSSPVTVIAGFGSVRGSPVTFATTPSPRHSVSGLVTGSVEDAGSSPGTRNSAFSGGGSKRHSIATSTTEYSIDSTRQAEWQPVSAQSVLPGIMSTSSTPDLRSNSEPLEGTVGFPTSTNSSYYRAVIRPLAVYGRAGNWSNQENETLTDTQTTTHVEKVTVDESKRSTRNDSKRHTQESLRDTSVTDTSQFMRNLSLTHDQCQRDMFGPVHKSRRDQVMEFSSEVCREWTDSPFEELHNVEVSQPPIDTLEKNNITGGQPSYTRAQRDQENETTAVASPRSDFHHLLHDQHHLISQFVAEFPQGVNAISTPHDSFADDELTIDVLIQTPRSLVGDNVPPVDHQLLSTRSLISTGVEAIVDSSDDFTQTDAEEDSSLHQSLLQHSVGSTSSTSSETLRIRAELDRLHQERIEIIELLSLKYLPGSLTVELLEAKLNYCLGQTDMLLASLEKAWAEEEPYDSSRHERSKKHEEFISEYREEFEQSRKDIKVCVEEARRVQNGTRGRRTARTRDLIAMQRRAQIEAFKQEREREQALYEEHRNMSPDMSDSSGPGSKRAFAPRFMTPKQHKEHLVRLRRSLVAASTEELNELRRRSHSSSLSLSPDRSFSPISSLSNVYQSRESSLCSSLSPDRTSAGLSMSSKTSVSFSTPSLVTPASYSSSNLHSSITCSTPSLHLSSGTQPAARHVSQSPEPTHYRPQSIPRHPKSYLAPRSSSCGPARGKHSFYPQFVDPLHHFLEYRSERASSCSRDSLDPEKLLQESYTARQLNRQQITKAQEALRLLEQHRHSFRSKIRGRSSRAHRQGPRRQEPRYFDTSPHTSINDLNEQMIEREIASLQQQCERQESITQSAGESTHLDSGLMSLSLQDTVNSTVPPDSTSTPRSEKSYAVYAKDMLVRNERHIQTIIAKSSHTGGTQEVHAYETSFGHSEASNSDTTPSSLQSTDLDSFLDTSNSSNQRSTPQFTGSRPISSQDIKARIARRLREKSKGKK